MTYGNTNCVRTRLSLSSNNFCASNSRRSEKYLGRLRTARTAPVWHWTHTAVCPLLLSDVKIGTFQQQQYCCPFQNEFGMCQKASSTKFDDKPGQPCSVCGMWTDRQTDRQTCRSQQYRTQCAAGQFIWRSTLPVHRYACFTSDTIEQIYKKFHIP